MSISSGKEQASPELVIDPQYGALLKGRWVPAPRFVLRRDRILAEIAGIPPGKVVEIGCGSGALLREFAARGHVCSGMETSVGARQLSKEMLAAFQSCNVVEEPDSDWRDSFDLLIACEVLEHIEHDSAALAQWSRWVRPGGRVILSVPAHMARWDQHDVWAGHFRRYGKGELVGLVEAAGLVVERVECYGFPLATMTRFLETLLARRRGFAGRGDSQAQATAASGIDRSTEIRLFRLQTSRIGRFTMATACCLQRLFLSKDWGDGYLLVASRPAF